LKEELQNTKKTWSQAFIEVRASCEKLISCVKAVMLTALESFRKTQKLRFSLSLPQFSVRIDYF
jgi:hypothetical protein